MRPMLRSLAVTATSLVLLFAASSAWAQNWVIVNPGDGKYAVHMPGHAKQTVQKVDTESGPVELHQAVVELGDDEAYVTTYADYSDKALQGQTPEARLTAVQAASLKAVNSKHLRFERAFSLSKWPARAYASDTGDGLVYSARIYLVGNRLYQNIAVTSAAKAESANVKRFLDSFRVIKP